MIEGSKNFSRNFYSCSRNLFHEFLFSVGFSGILSMSQLFRNTSDVIKSYLEINQIILKGSSRRVHHNR